MDKAETLDVQLRRILEKLKQLGDGTSEQLPSLEKYIQEQITALLDAEAEIGELYKKIFKFFIPNELHDFDDKTVQYSGSMVEGAIMARCFQKREAWKEIEMDVMFNMFTIPQEASHLLEAVEGRPGFSRLPYQELVTTCPDLTEQPNHLFTVCPDLSAKYISPQATEDANMIAGPVPSADSILNEHLPSLASVLNMTDMKDAVKSYFEIDNTRSKTETTVEWNIKSCIANLSTDFVPSVRLLFWPHEAKSWITRRRLWPLQDTIQSIVDEGCQVVPRSSPGGDANSEWRLSFSIPEKTLAQLRSKNQRQTYYFFKVFF